MNEELETAKEELQSTNEELTTVNDELQGRSAEVGDVNSDLLNVLSSVELPVILVDRELRLRRFTPKATKVLNVIASDVGRPISDIKPNVPCRTSPPSSAKRSRRCGRTSGTSRTGRDAGT